jgi:hypothetical protein
LIGLREETKPKIIFTTGHGELSIDVSDAARRGAGVWKSRLAATGADVVALNPLRDEIPTDAAIVIVAAPTAAFKPEEVNKLKAYSDRGGPLLILASNTNKSGLDEFLRSCNLVLGPGIVIDRRLNYGGQASLVFAPVVSTLHHPIVDPLVDRAVLVPAAAPIQMLGARGTQPANPGLIATPILKTSNISWAETDLTSPRAELDPNKDERGPITVGATVSDRPKPGMGTEGKPRLVFFSSGDLARNDVLQIEQSNLDLLMNAISWLRGRSGLQGLAPKTHVALTLTADPLLRARLVMVPTVMAFLLIVGLGITTYAARRE